jgi:hypothetical protein
VTVIYKMTKGGRGGRSDPEVVTAPDEIHQAVQSIDSGTGRGVIEEDAGETKDGA